MFSQLKPPPEETLEHKYPPLGVYLQCMVYEQRYTIHDLQGTERTVRQWHGDVAKRGREEGRAADGEAMDATIYLLQWM
jgi:hypothetical protein